MRIVANQDQSLRANEHSKNKWKVDSLQAKKVEHIERLLHPLILRISSVGNLSCISVHTKKDFEGGISGLRIVLANEAKFLD